MLALKFSAEIFREAMNSVTNCLPGKGCYRTGLENVCVTVSNMIDDKGECSVRFEACDGYMAARYYCTAQYETDQIFGYSDKKKILFKLNPKITIKAGPVQLMEIAGVITITQGDQSWTQKETSDSYIDLDKVLIPASPETLDICFDPKVLMAVCKAAAAAGQRSVHFRFGTRVNGCCMDGERTRCFVLPKRFDKSAEELYGKNRD